MNRIHFFQEDTKFNLTQRRKYKQWLSNVATLEGYSIECINYIFCSDDFLLEINKKHLQHDFYTDIITFGIESDPILADIYISVDRVKENSISLGVAFYKELARVMVHGVLHLCGHSDHSVEEKNQMRILENAAIEALDSIIPKNV